MRFIAMLMSILVLSSSFITPIVNARTIPTAQINVNDLEIETENSVVTRQLPLVDEEGNIRIKYGPLESDIFPSSYMYEVDGETIVMSKDGTSYLDGSKKKVKVCTTEVKDVTYYPSDNISCTIDGKSVIAEGLGVKTSPNGKLERTDKKNVTIETNSNEEFITHTTGDGYSGILYKNGSSYTGIVSKDIYTATYSQEYTGYVERYVDTYSQTYIGKVENEVVQPVTRAMARTMMSMASVQATPPEIGDIYYQPLINVSTTNRKTVGIKTRDLDGSAHTISLYHIWGGSGNETQKTLVQTKHIPAGQTTFPSDYTYFEVPNFESGPGANYTMEFQVYDNIGYKYKSFITRVDTDKPAVNRLVPLTANSLSDPILSATRATLGGVIGVQIEPKMQDWNYSPKVTIGNKQAIVTKAFNNYYWAYIYVDASMLNTKNYQVVVYDYYDTAGNQGDPYIGNITVEFDNTIKALDNLSVITSNTEDFQVARTGDVIYLHFGNDDSSGYGGHYGSVKVKAFGTEYWGSADDAAYRRIEVHIPVDGNIINRYAGKFEFTASFTEFNGRSFSLTHDDMPNYVYVGYRDADPSKALNQPNLTFHLGQSLYAGQQFNGAGSYEFVKVYSSNRDKTIAEVGDITTVEFKTNDVANTPPTLTMDGKQVTAYWSEGTYKAQFRNDGKSATRDLTFKIHSFTSKMGGTFGEVNATTDRSKVSIKAATTGESSYKINRIYSTFDSNNPKNFGYNGHITAEVDFSSINSVDLSKLNPIVLKQVGGTSTISLMYSHKQGNKMYFTYTQRDIWYTASSWTYNASSFYDLEGKPIVLTSADTGAMNHQQGIATSYGAISVYDSKGNTTNFDHRYPFYVKINISTSQFFEDTYPNITMAGIPTTTKVHEREKGYFVLEVKAGASVTGTKSLTASALTAATTNYIQPKSFNMTFAPQGTYPDAVYTDKVISSTGTDSQRLNVGDTLFISLKTNRFQYPLPATAEIMGETVNNTSTTRGIVSFKLKVTKDHEEGKVTFTIPSTSAYPELTDKDFNSNYYIVKNGDGWKSVKLTSSNGRADVGNGDRVTLEAELNGIFLDKPKVLFNGMEIKSYVVGNKLKATYNVGANTPYGNIGFRVTEVKTSNNAGELSEADNGFQPYKRDYGKYVIYGGYSRNIINTSNLPSDNTYGDDKPSEYFIELGMAGEIVEPGYAVYENGYKVLLFPGENNTLLGNIDRSQAQSMFVQLSGTKIKIGSQIIELNMRVRLNPVANTHVQIGTDMTTLVLSPNGNQFDYYSSTLTGGSSIHLYFPLGDIAGSYVFNQLPESFIEVKNSNEKFPYTIVNGPQGVSFVTNVTRAMEGKVLVLTEDVVIASGYSNSTRTNVTKVGVMPQKLLPYTITYSDSKIRNASELGYHSAIKSIKLVNATDRGANIANNEKSYTAGAYYSDVPIIAGRSYIAARIYLADGYTLNSASTFVSFGIGGQYGKMGTPANANYINISAQKYIHESLRHYPDQYTTNLSRYELIDVMPDENLILNTPTGGTLTIPKNTFLGNIDTNAVWKLLWSGGVEKGMTYINGVQRLYVDIGHPGLVMTNLEYVDSPGAKVTEVHYGEHGTRLYYNEEWSLGPQLWLGKATFKGAKDNNTNRRYYWDINQYVVSQPANIDSVHVPTEVSVYSSQANNPRAAWTGDDISLAEFRPHPYDGIKSYARWYTQGSYDMGYSLVNFPKTVVSMNSRAITSTATMSSEIYSGRFGFNGTLGLEFEASAYGATATTDGTYVEVVKKSQFLSNLSVRANTGKTSVVDGNNITVSFKYNYSPMYNQNFTLNYGKYKYTAKLAATNTVTIPVNSTNMNQGPIGFELILPTSAGHLTEVNDSSNTLTYTATAGNAVSNIEFYTHNIANQKNAYSYTATYEYPISAKITFAKKLARPPIISFSGQLAEVRVEGNVAYATATVKHHDSDGFVILRLDKDTDKPYVGYDEYKYDSYGGYFKSTSTMNALVNSITIRSLGVSPFYAQVGDTIELSMEMVSSNISQFQAVLGGKLIRNPEVISGVNGKKTVKFKTKVTEDMASGTLGFHIYKGFALHMNSLDRYTNIDDYRQTTDGSYVIIGSPTKEVNIELQSLSIKSNNGYSNNLAKTSDTISAILTLNRDADISNVVINGEIASVIHMATGVYELRTIVKNTTTNGTTTISFGSISGSGSSVVLSGVIATTDRSYVLIDTKAPTVTSITPTQSVIRIGDTVKVAINFSERLGNTPTVKLNGSNLSVSRVSADHYVASFTVTSAMSTATLRFEVSSYRDVSGNFGGTYTNTSSMKIATGDLATLDSVTISTTGTNGIAKDGDTIIIKVTSNTTLKEPASSHINENLVTTSSRGKTLEYRYVISSRDPIGEVKFDIRGIETTDGRRLVDTITSTTNGSKIIVQRNTNPNITNNMYSSGTNPALAKSGDTLFVKVNTTSNIKDMSVTDNRGGVYTLYSSTSKEGIFSRTVNDSTAEGTYHGVIVNLELTDGTLINNYSNFNTYVSVDRTPPNVINFTGGSNLMEITFSEVVKNITVQVGEETINLTGESNKFTVDRPVVEKKVILKSAEDLAGNKLIDHLLADNTPYLDGSSSGVMITISGVVNGGVYNDFAIPSYTAASIYTSDVTVSSTLNGAPYTSGRPVTQVGSYELIVNAIDNLGNSDNKIYEFVVN